jgi:LacI family transcriptional regulator, galactose operon repressor
VSQPTLRDVAAMAGVHPATASRALNPGTRSLISPRTADRVLRAAEQLGYQPNAVARSLRTSRSSSIGVVVPDLTNPLFPPIVRGIEDALAPHGYVLLIVNTDNDPELEDRLIASLRSRSVDGLILATARLGHPLLRVPAEIGFPVVLANRRTEGLPFPSVTADDASGIHAAVAHLAGLGHRRIAHIAGPQDTSTGMGRLRAFRSAMQEHGLPVDAALIRRTSAWLEDEGARALSDLLDANRPFSAIFAGNDMLALGCYDVLAERGLRCPEDLSVVGFNDMPLVDKLRPGLTTVHIPHYDIGWEAGRMMLDELTRGEQQAKAVLMPVSLSIRESTGPPGQSAHADHDAPAGHGAKTAPSGTSLG